MGQIYIKPNTNNLVRPNSDIINSLLINISIQSKRTE